MSPQRSREVPTATALAVVFALAVVLVLATATPAGAATPAGDTESFVTAIEPATPAIAVRVLGGDETLRIDVAPGHEVVVLGYADEPYLRIDPDGVVFENQRSPAVAANADRYNSTAPTADADPGAEPVWGAVGTGGSHEWHDHRMHWMAESVPAPGEPGDLVFAWTVGLTVDGSPVAVTGELRRGEAAIVWPFLVLIVAAGAATVVVGRGRPVAAAVASAGVVTAIALVLTIGERVALVCWTCGRLAILAPVVIASLATAASLVVRREGIRVLAAATALVALTGWLLVHVRVLTEAVVVSALADPVVRGAVSAALGATVGGVWVTACYGRRVLDEYASRPPSQRGRRARSSRARPTASV